MQIALVYVSIYVENCLSMPGKFLLDWKRYNYEQYCNVIIIIIQSRLTHRSCNLMNKNNALKFIGRIPLILCSRAVVAIARGISLILLRVSWIVYRGIWTKLTLAYTDS